MEISGWEGMGINGLEGMGIGGWEGMEIGGWEGMETDEWEIALAGGHGIGACDNMEAWVQNSAVNAWELSGYVYMASGE